MIPFQVEFRKPGKDQIIPGDGLDLRIDTTAGTRLGVVIVDESVYLLRDKNRLTKERVSYIYIFTFSLELTA